MRDVRPGVKQTFRELPRDIAFLGTKRTCRLSRRMSAVYLSYGKYRRTNFRKFSKRNRFARLLIGAFGTIMSNA